MLLKNDVDGRNLLKKAISNYYESDGGRTIYLFRTGAIFNEGWHEEHCLLDRKHVFRCSIGQDRNLWIAELPLAIGPHYFGPAQFWDYENAERFKMEASTEAVQHNLRLLDEFLGYPVSKPPI